MKRALTLLSLSLLAACASNDGFIENNKRCGPGDEVGIEAGWGTPGSAMERNSNQLTLLVRVFNNSNGEIRVKRVYADPMTMERDSPYEVERGSLDPNQVIAEGDEATFEVPMIGRRRLDARAGTRANPSVDLSVTVLLEPDQSYRCRFELPVGF